jgi:hypothetical protein
MCEAVQPPILNLKREERTSWSKNAPDFRKSAIL